MGMVKLSAALGSLNPSMPIRAMRNNIGGLNQWVPSRMSQSLNTDQGNLDLRAAAPKLALACLSQFLNTDQGYSDQDL